ncbi:MAG: glutamate-5-semialdehyde dehydrogenase, partial [Phycisphaerae bacterium]|nr:glutamate-5-semialdehyde dehydrogenase [Phycisphaerae bacterium]
MDADQHVKKIATAARAAAAVLASSAGGARNAALHGAAVALRDGKKAITAANAKDLATAGQAGLSEALIDRLRLTDAGIEAMAASLEQIAAQNDPVGATISAAYRPDGLRVEKRRVPIGVVGIIYESRPNVTADAAGLCLKSGNACILRGGKEALHSNLAIAQALRSALEAAKLPAAAVTVVESTDHAIVTALCRAEGLIDLIIPRGGEALIRAVVEAATIPVIKHYAGNCHVYVHAAADLDMAERIVVNAKCQRPGICNAAETLLVDAAVAKAFLPRVATALMEQGVELRGCDRSRKLVPAMKTASEDDWRKEYLELILAVRVVDDLGAAIEHINTYGSHHTDAIVTESLAA